MSNLFYQAPECTILMTGCSSGIGLYCALKMHEMGFNVIATARKTKDVHALRSQGLNAYQLDLDNSTSIKLALKQILAQTNHRIDVLFNNAGFGQPGAVEDLDRESIRRQFETNVFGLIELTNLVIPIMRRQGHGRIIQNSSVLGLVSLAFRGAYNASKYALEGFSDTLRLELYGTGIEVSLIEPGPIESKFREHAHQKFCENIDKVNSSWAQAYQAVENRLANKSEKPGPFTLGPEAVLAKVLKILKSRKAKPRYYVTVPTYMFGILKRICSASLLDYFLRRVMHKELQPIVES